MKTELTFYEGLVEETALWDPLGRLFEDIDILLCPTSCNHRTAGGQRLTSTKRSSSRARLYSTTSWR